MKKKPSAKVAETFKRGDKIYVTCDGVEHKAKYLRHVTGDFHKVRLRGVIYAGGIRTVNELRSR